MSATPAPAQRIFVTGGRGRLASLIAGQHRPPASEVALFSRDAGDGFRPLAELLRHDVLAQADVLLHLAWSTLPATSERQPGLERQNDLPFLESLLGALIRSAARERLHFIFFSSGGTVYGDAPGRPNVETDSCRPIGNYGRAKLAAEEMILALAERHGLACAILRISNPFGYPVPADRVQGIIPHAIRCATTGQPLALWGDGSARKDFLHCQDFLPALASVIKCRLTGVYNLCAGESHSIREVIEQVEAQVGRKIPLAYAPAPAWDVQDSRLDNRKLVAATGWRPQVTLAEGIRREASSSAPP
jgi:UDP-glucose 4-epimerase